MFSMMTRTTPTRRRRRRRNGRTSSMYSNKDKLLIVSCQIEILRAKNKVRSLEAGRETESEGVLDTE